MLRVADHFERSDTGRARRENEDSFYARSPMFAVADGMGGAQAGEVASQLAVEVLQKGLPDGRGSVEQRLRDLVEEANARINALSRADDQRAGMGTTMTLAYVGEDELSVAHVGDSRLYRLREGGFERLTDDHTLVEELVRQGKLTPQEADTHPQRSIITRALGPEAAVETDSHTWPARDGDVYLICSDGLTSMISEGQVGEIMVSARSLEEAGRRLIDAANAAGGRDNITVILFRLEEVAAAGAGGPQDTTEHEAVTGAEAARTGPATAAGAAAAGPATAVARGNDDHTTTEQAIIDDAAQRLNVSPEALRSALGAAEDSQLDQAVKDGKLTQEQADAIKKRRQQAGDVLGGPGVGVPGPGGPGGPGFGGRGLGFKSGPGGALDAAASALGLKRADLLTKLRAGKSIADLAKAQGKSLDDVKQAITAGVTKELDQAVTDKKLTSAQRDDILKELGEHLDDLVTRTPPQGAAGPGLGRPPGLGHHWR